MQSYFPSYTVDWHCSDDYNHLALVLSILKPPEFQEISIWWKNNFLVYLKTNSAKNRVKNVKTQSMELP